MLDVLSRRCRGLTSVVSSYDKSVGCVSVCAERTRPHMVLMTHIHTCQQLSAMLVQVATAVL